MDSVLSLHPAAPGSILRIPESFSENLGRSNSMLQRFIDGPAHNIGQRLDNVNQNHLVLASWYYKKYYNASVICE